MGDKETITMKDIARDLGVSVATVSRALKDSSRISTAQKERIQKYAREHNFFPNFLGEALRHNQGEADEGDWSYCASGGTLLLHVGAFGYRGRG